MTTKISDIITPDAWAEYGVQRTRELSALWQSGIVAPIAGLQLPNGGGTLNLPHFADLTGDAEVLSDSNPLTAGKITAGAQVAVVLGRGKAWGVNDLAGVMAGADPAKAIMDLLAGYWARQDQRELIATLSGVFAATSMAGNLHDVSGATGAAAVFTGETFLDATQKLGDAKDSLTAIAMHSAVENKLAKDGLIVYVVDALSQARVPYYMGKRVIVDDGLPAAAGVYTSFLFGPGAVGYAAAPIGPQDLETDRDILAGDTVLAMRRREIIHVAGSKWVGTAAGARLATRLDERTLRRYFFVLVICMALLMAYRAAGAG